MNQFNSAEKFKKVRFLNVEVDNVTCDELLHNLKKGVLTTPNIDDIVKHQKDKTFYKEAIRADYHLCDSRILQLLSKFTGNPLKEAIPGSSFFPKFCDFHAKNPAISIFLLGAKEGVADKARSRINNRIGRDIICGVYSPSFGFEKDEEECALIIDKIKKSGANVVLVGLGNPKQVHWIFKYKDQLPEVDIFMALGATIDFEAGNVSRAPRFMQKIGMEWFYRFCMEPQRLFKRYFIDDIQFFYYYFLQLIGKYKNPFENISD